MGTKFTEARIQEIVAHNLKRLRSVHKISQMDLGNLSGLAHNTINEIEAAKKGISFASIAKLVNALGIEPHQLFLPPFSADTIEELYGKDFSNQLTKVTSDFLETYLQSNREPKKR